MNQIEVDQSGKIELLSQDTIIAYSNDRQYSIRIALITRNSNAHHVAIETFREEHKPNEVLTEKQIWRLLK